MPHMIYPFLDGRGFTGFLLLWIFFFSPFSISVDSGLEELRSPCGPSAGHADRVQPFQGGHLCSRSAGSLGAQVKVELR